MEEWPKVRTRPNSREFHEYTYDIHVRIGKRVHNVAVVQYPRSSSMCKSWGIEPKKQLEPKVKRFDLSKDRLLSWPVSILHEK